MNYNKLFMNQIISISFPKELLEKANKYIPAQKRSKAIVKAFDTYLDVIKKRKIEVELGSMYDNMTENEKQELLAMSEESLVDELSKSL